MDGRVTKIATQSREGAREAEETRNIIIIIII